MEKMVNVYFFGKKYTVPADLTIMTAMEYAGYTLKRGCGCRHGFCGACATIYRIKGKNELKTGLSCQTQVEEGMYVASIPYFPTDKRTYEIDEIRPEQRVMMELYPEIYSCIGCNACRYGKPCVQKDGFNDLIPKIKTADLIVFASPLLFWTLSSKIKAFIERFYCIAEEDQNPPLGRYERYPVKDAALLMTSADNYFWTYEQAISYYKFAMINYIGFQDKGMLLAGGCGDTNGKPQIDKTNHLRDAYNFGKNIYRE